MERKVELSKLMKKGKMALVLGTIFLLVGIGIFSYGFIEFNKIKNNPVEMASGSEGEYSKIDVNLMTEYFATDDADNPTEKVYFVYDEDYMYLASIDDETMKDLEAIKEYSYDEEKEFPGTVTIYGTLTKIPDDLKKLAISSFNEMYDYKVTDDFYLRYTNFNEYFGYYYLDTNVGPMNDDFPYILIMAGMFLIIGITSVIAFAKNRMNSKKCLEGYKEDIEKIEAELNSESTVDHSKYNFYLTDHYVITYGSGLKVINYNDIVWLYPKEVSYRGNVTRTIFVVTKDSKIHTVCALNVNKKTRELLDEMYQALLMRIPKEALAGFTSENRLKVKELYTKKK